MNINNNTGRGNTTQINRSNFAPTRSSAMQNANNLSDRQVPHRVRHLSHRISFVPQRGYTQLTPEMIEEARVRQTGRIFLIINSEDYNIIIIARAFSGRELPYYRFQREISSQGNRTTRNVSGNLPQAEVLSVEPVGLNVSFSSFEGAILVEATPEGTAESRGDTRQQSDSEEEHN